MGRFCCPKEYRSRICAGQKTAHVNRETFFEPIPRDRHSQCGNHARTTIAGLKTESSSDRFVGAGPVIPQIRLARRSSQRDGKSGVLP